MRSRLASESGFSLMELLMAMTLMIVVLGATLSPFDAFQRTAATTQLQNEAQDNVRLTTEAMARALRNVQAQSQAIERASSSDLVFQTTDHLPKPGGSSNAGNIMRVRYCLDAANASDGRLIRQVQRWTTSSPPASLPSASSCPDVDWGVETRVVAEKIVNNDGGPVPVFSYGLDSLGRVTMVRTDFQVDADTTRPPGRIALRSGVFLRNQSQNTAPTARFAAEARTGGTVYLNGTDSSDPDGDTLTYRWCDVTTNPTCDASTQIGAGATYTYEAPGSAGSSRTLVLRVSDPGGMSHEAAPVTVTLE
jgi:type II secretory pathway pseudopilin PulG